MTICLASSIAAAVQHSHNKLPAQTTIKKKQLCWSPRAYIWIFAAPFMCTNVYLWRGFQYTEKSAAVAQHTNGVRQVLRAGGICGDEGCYSGWYSFVLYMRSVHHDYDQQSCNHIFLLCGARCER